MHALSADTERLTLLRRLELLDSPREPVYDGLVELAADVTGFPAAVLTLWDGERQWFKASVGVDVRETPARESLCAHTIVRGEPLILPDLGRHDEFAAHPARSSVLGVQSYVGVPVRCDAAVGTGLAVASLAVFAPEPRKIEARHVERLRRIAAAIERLFAKRLMLFHAARRREAPAGESDLVFSPGRFDELPGMLYRCANDESWTIQFASAGTEALTGYRPEEIIGNALISYAQLIHEDDRQRVADEVAAAITERRAFRIRYRIRTATGALKWVEEQGRRVADGSLEGYVCDISAQVQRERERDELRELANAAQAEVERLREQQALMRIAGRLARVGGWSLDLAADHVSWSDEIFDILEVPHGVEPPLSESLSWYPDEWRPLIVGAIERCAADGTPFDLELEILTRSGRRLRVRAAGEAKRDPDGRVTRVVGVFMDISEAHAAREALRVSRERYETALAGSAAAIWDWDIVNQRIFLSDRYFALVGYRPGETARDIEEYFSLVHPDDRAPTRAAVQAHLETGAPYKVEYRIAHRTQGYRWFAAEGTALRDADGRPTRMAGSIVDIHELKLAEALARGGEEALRQTFESITDGFYTITPEWRFGMLNAQAERLLGRSRDELVGRDLFDEFPAVRGTQFEQNYREAMETGRSVTFEEFYPAPLDRWYSVRVFPSSRGLAVYFQDISERVERQAQLRKQAAFIDQASDAILEVDLAGQILFWNHGAERIYGYAAAEVVGKLKAEVLSTDIDAMRESLEAVQRDGHWSGERDAVTRLGETVKVFARWTLLTDERGVPQSVLIIDTDITERRKIEQQFLRSQRLESIGTLAGGIAHDLNNVLAPIMLSIELLKADETDAVRLETIETIEQSAKRGADMVRQVLSFARGVEGRRVDLQLRHVIDDVAKIVRDTFPKNLELSVDVPEDLWLLSADPTQLHQVLLNLCVNARDAMPSGGPLRIRASNVHLDQHYAQLAVEASPGPHIMLEVEDRGHGMTPDVIEKIFDPFFTTKAPGRGTGLGLSTSLAIVRSHGGFVRVYSEPGKGSRFRLYLPANLTASAVDVARAARALPRGSGELILVVDDETSVRDITKATLESFGYRVRLAVDGADAVSQFASIQNEVALVLTDMMMPIMDGATLVQILRKMRPGVRIIAVSGLASDGRVHHVANLGVRHFLPKPYTAETLLSTIRSALDDPGVTGGPVVHEAP